MMRRLPCLCALLIAASISSTSKADMILNINLTLNLVSGGDTLGLNGANVHFNAIFADGVTYVDVFGSPAAAATSHSLTIASATNPASNATFADPDGFLYTPNSFDALWIDNAANYLIYRTPTIASGLSFKFGLSMSPPSMLPTVGSFVNPSDFSTTSTAFSSLEAVTNDFAAPSATYSIRANSLTTSYLGSSNPSAVPEPSSLALFVIGSVCVIGRRWRRQLQVKSANRQLLSYFVQD